MDEFSLVARDIVLVALTLVSSCLCVVIAPALIVLILLIPGENKEAIARKARERNLGVKPTDDDPTMKAHSQNDDGS